MPEPRASRRSLALGVVVASLAAVTLGYVVSTSRANGGEDMIVPGAASTEPAAPGKDRVTWTSGAFGGDFGVDNVEFGQWRGRPLGSVLYFAEQSTWEDTARATKSIQIQHAEALTVREDVLPVISYAMWPVSERTGSLAKGAAGEYDDKWRAIAVQLVERDLGNAVIRPGWEFNGTWYRWSAEGDQGARDFAAYFRNIVDAMRSVSGEDFRFSWSPVQMNGGVDLALAYPGDDYVDDIGFDVYNARWERYISREKNWEMHLNIKYGLKWQLNFAREHGKDISFPEWGGYLTTQKDRRQFSSGDDTYFIRKMFDWMQKHPPAYENYFNFDTTYGLYYGLNTENDTMPRSAEAYQELWGLPG